jgi:ParB/RepB/Spo0J family partition protein
MPSFSFLEVPLSSIDEGDRFRKQYDNIAELAADIKEKGLINPLTLRSNADGKRYTLMAGGRRLNACRLLQMETAPACVHSHELSELELRSIELAENIQRENLTWTEEVELKKAIHDLQVQVHGEKEGYTGKGEVTGWSKADTAKLLRQSPATVSLDLKLANMREALPELPWDKCKNKADAQKLIKTMEEKVITAELAKRAQAKKMGGDTRKIMDAYIVGDFFEGCKKLPDKSFQFIEVDPPYAIDLLKAKMSSNQGMLEETESYTDVEQKVYREFLDKLFTECYRVASTHAWLVCWFAPEPWFEEVYDALTKAGWTARRMCGIWTKGYGQAKRPEMHLANTYEMFFYARKGEPCLLKPGRSNIFDFKPVPAQAKTHPTERPIELLEELISTFGPGSNILVPFAGSGATLLAAFRGGHNAVGFDLSKEYKDSYLVRVSKGGAL